MSGKTSIPHGIYDDEALAFIAARHSATPQETVRWALAAGAGGAARLEPNEREIILGLLEWYGNGSGNAVVAAGAIVNRDVEPGTVVGGVPAKKIKDITSESKA